MGCAGGYRPRGRSRRSHSPVGCKPLVFKQATAHTATVYDSLEIEGILPSKASQEKTEFLDLRLVSFVLILVLPLSSCAGDPAKESILGHGPSAASFSPQRLTEIGKTQLNAILGAAQVADLRWPAFGRYQSEVRDFYDSSDGLLPWMRESRTRSTSARDHSTPEPCR